VKDKLNFSNYLPNPKNNENRVFIAGANAGAKLLKEPSCTYTLELTESSSQGEGGEFGGTGATTISPTVHVKGTGRLDIKINDRFDSKGDIRSKKTINFVSYSSQILSGITVNKQERTNLDKIYNFFPKSNLVVEAHCSQSTPDGKVKKIRAKLIPLPPLTKSCILWGMVCGEDKRIYPED
jgi:hypothetical protein